MDIELDPEKDQINRDKHKVPLALGLVVLQNRIVDIADPRIYETEFGPEHRRVAYGLVGDRLFNCVYTMRGEAFRLISVRKANKREQRKWLL